MVGDVLRLQTTDSIQNLDIRESHGSVIWSVNIYFKYSQQGMDQIFYTHITHLHLKLSMLAAGAGLSSPGYVALAAARAW